MAAKKIVVPEPPKPEPLPEGKTIPGAAPGEVPAKCIVGSQDLKWFYLLTTPEGKIVLTDTREEAWEFTRPAEALALAKECSEAEDISGRKKLPDNIDVEMIYGPPMIAYLVGPRNRLIPLKE
jgi:hypothetical protein